MLAVLQVDGRRALFHVHLKTGEEHAVKHAVNVREGFTIA